MKQKDWLREIGSYLLIALAILGVTSVILLLFNFWFEGSLAKFSDNVRGIIPVVALLYFIVCPIFFAASFFVSKDKKNMLRKISAVLVLLGVIGLIVAALPQYLCQIQVAC